jgi:hypothetical protein
MISYNLELDRVLNCLKIQLKFKGLKIRKNNMKVKKLKKIKKLSCVHKL